MFPICTFVRTLACFKCVSSINLGMCLLAAAKKKKKTHSVAVIMTHNAVTWGFGGVCVYVCMCLCVWRAGGGWEVVRFSLRRRVKAALGWGIVQTDLEHTVCFGMESRCEFVSNENKELRYSHSFRPVYRYTCLWSGGQFWACGDDSNGKCT